MSYLPRCFFHNYKINLPYIFPQDYSIFIYFLRPIWNDSFVVGQVLVFRDGEESSLFSDGGLLN